MNLGRRTLIALSLLAGSSAVFGSPALNRLLSFGSPDQAAANPCAELIEGSDGKLYGTTAAGGAAGQGTVFRIAKDGSAFQLLRRFAGTNDGSRPVAAVIEASDGALYGVSSKGGQFGFGTVFRMNKDGSSFAVLKHFTGGTDGAYPEARLLEASDGLLYGTASGGGTTNDYGTVFQLSKDGLVFSSLFPFAGTNGANPEAGLIEASDGMLYGTTSAGGTTNSGVAFRLNKNGTSFTLLQSFGPDFYSTNGSTPLARLVEATNGLLFGTASAGGNQQSGTLFEINKDGSGFLPVHQFSNTLNEARFPCSGLILASDGWLYGTTFDGGTNSNGSIIRLAQNGSNYVVLASISRLQGPSAALLEGSDGALYGTAQLGGDSGAGGIFKIQKNGSGFTILKSFSPSGGDGASPIAPLARAGDGTLFGTTRLGGATGAGSVFSLRFDGMSYHLLSSLFATNGSGPLAGVTEAANGLLYGVARSDDMAANETIFDLQKDGSGLNLLFASTSANNGQDARGTLAQGTNGLLYGTAMLGGTSHQGTLYQFNPTNSNFVVLKNFATALGGPGANPAAGVLVASDGRLYGTTYAGGSNNGVVFGLNQDSTGFAVLKSFNGTNEGTAPVSPLLEASDGMLYGSTYGGSTNDAGTIFRLNKNGSGFQILLTFLGTNVDGRHPCGKLAEGSDGAIYGTTEWGGTNDCGTLFRLNKNGTGYTRLATFSDSSGKHPHGGLVIGPDGAFYGTTDQGGASGFGAVFRYGEPIEEIFAVQLSAGQVTLSCLGQGGTNYWIERTAQIGPSALWQPLYSTNAPSGGIFSAADPNPLPQTAFYRLRR